MQKMEIDAVTVGRKNRCTEQMIGIHKHCGKHYQIGLPPVFSKKNICN